MRFQSFASRNIKEIARDPLTVFFGLGFPLAILLLLSAIQANIPVEMFEINRLAPGIAVFGLSFVSLFSGTLISKDREESFLVRLFASPMKPSDFITAYTLPLIPIAVLQTVICFAAAALLGMKISLSTLVCLAVLLPADILFAAIGLLAGSILNNKQVGGICGALLTNLSAWLSGTWFSLDLVGGWFKRIAYALPFARAVEAGRAALTGSGSVTAHLIPVLLWAAGLTAAAILIFMRQLRSDH